MKIYLAGVIPFSEKKNIGGGFDKAIKEWHPYILESFYYADADTERLIPYYGDFLLDSGAFTFMGGFSFTASKKSNIDFYDYVERYAAFIVKNKVEKFFELDVDSVVGYEKVKEFRKILEIKTGKPSIPVWHSSRGFDEFKRTCQEYDYVALGGIVGGEWNAKAEKYIPLFIKTAHEYGAKIHGLGFTKLEKLKIYHFDSVDSTAWTTGNRFGYLYYFDGKTVKKREAPKGHRIEDSKAAAINNYVEWIKYQQFAERNL